MSYVAAELEQFREERRKVFLDLFRHMHTKLVRENPDAYAPPAKDIAAFMARVEKCFPGGLIYGTQKQAPAMFAVCKHLGIKCSEQAVVEWLCKPEPLAKEKP